ncbi:glycine oxidase ThiO [Paenibacillus physcomitrellae]|uniref:glycine oxidase n=1 Tax=Paenibacillus physcomitrellae TaxID=1619311 RepID=A0ABQ1GP31_9BACL|nr:glycine oxidase ThiO [Paenibacillus physcomitrellae]GGA47625.1 glycine oxidase ThiO [Paenibacillus physcomitrellae]
MKQRIIVMGGGVIGLASAFELASRGYEVAVLETGRCGGQASGAAAGMLAPYSENLESPDEFFRLCLESLQLYPAWQARVKEVSGCPFEYTESGSLYIVYHEADMLALESRRLWQREYGSSAAILEGDALFAREPQLSRQVRAALWTPEESHVYAPDYVKALEEGCRRLGVVIVEELAELEWVEQDGAVQVKARDGRVFLGDQLLVCTGAWAGKMSEQLGIVVPIRPIRGQICAYHTDGFAEPLHHMVFSSQGYLVQKESGPLVCGASEDMAGFDSSVTERGINRLMEWNKKMMPALAGETPFHRWAGLRPATQDGAPLIGRLADHPNVVLAAGHYRNGILLSPVTAKLAADIMDGGELPGWTGAFRPDRFGTVSTIA